MMQEVLDEICSYLKYLNADLGLSVSVHFSSEKLSGMPSQVFNKLLPYNVHKNPFCAHVKSKCWDKCIAHQQNILSLGKTENGFCLSCHAGVDEYVRCFYAKDSVAGYIAVSGYRGLKNFDAKTPHIEQLKDQPIPVQFLKTIISPLARTFEKLFSFEFNNLLNDENKLIIQYLSERHGQATLDDVCKYFSRSKSYISHLFNRSNGRGFSKYCNDLKLNYSKELIKKTNLSIIDVAIEAGFNDVSYFILQFKKAFGETPKKFKKRCESATNKPLKIER